MRARTRIDIAGGDTAAGAKEVSSADFEIFARDTSLRLRRALVARYGVDVGVDAAADAMAYAWEHWDAVEAMANPTGYLWRVGQTSAGRQHRWRRAPLLPPEVVIETAAFEPGLPAALRRLRPDERVAVVLVHGY